MDIAKRLHNLMLRPGFQAREDQETLLDGKKEIDRLEAEVNRLATAIAKIANCSAQCGEDAMKMRDIATSAHQWHRPDSMWWSNRDRINEDSMTTNGTKIDLIACAIFEASTPTEPAVTWEQLPEGIKEGYRAYARAAIKAYEDNWGNDAR